MIEMVIRIRAGNEGLEWVGEHEALGIAMQEAGDRGIDTNRPFTVLWDRLAQTLDVSQEQPEV